jgi:hypothetical protein
MPFCSFSPFALAASSSCAQRRTRGGQLGDPLEPRENTYTARSEVERG